MSNFEDDDDRQPLSADDLDSMYGSRYLTGEYIGNRRIKTCVESVYKALMRQQSGPDKPKGVLVLKGLPKDLPLNDTNYKTLVKAGGKDPAKWRGLDLELFTVETVKGLGVRFIVLPKQQAAQKPQAAQAPKAASISASAMDEMPSFDPSDPGPSEDSYGEVF
jgi:hypothetical protein